MSDPATGRTVLHADRGAYRRWFGQPVRGLGVIVALVVGGVGSAFRRGDGALLFWLILAAVIVTLGAIAIQIATSRVILTPDRIEYRRWLRRTRLRLDDDLIGALAELNASPVGRTSQVLVLRARSGGRRIWLNGAYWDQEDLVRVAAVAGVPVLDEELTPRDVHRIAPGSMPHRVLHPWPYGLVGAVVVLAVIVGGVVAWWDVKGLPPFDDQPPRAVAQTTTAAQDSLVAGLERAIGGEWESPDVRLVTCQDADDYKGWSRRVEVRLRETVDEETGEDVIVTPLTPTRDILMAVGRTLVENGHDEPNVADDELEEVTTTGDGYLGITSVPERDGPGASDVDMSFYGRGSAAIVVSSSCETGA